MTENEQMLTAILGCERMDLILERPSLSPRQNKLYQQMRSRRRHHEPLQYIIGSCDFMGVSLKVDKRVLIPRPETEILVEKALALLREKAFSQKLLRVLDLGTGSGNMAIALAKHMPNAHITSVDISQDALDVARHNAVAHQLEARIAFICMDMAIFLAEAEGGYDLVISNPPYIPSGQLSSLPLDVQQEPELALDGGQDGLDFYRIIMARTYRLLNKEGFLFLEIGDGQRQGLERLFQKYPYYQGPVFYQDYRGIDRIVQGKPL